MRPSIAYIDQLQKTAVEEVSFYPKVALERGIEGGLIEMAEENGQPCGYLYRSRPVLGRDINIWQAVIEYDLRRQHLGAALVDKLLADAQTAGSRSVQLRCRSSIDANRFWAAMGFTCVDVRPGGKKRNADLNIWRRDVQPALFAMSTEPSAVVSDQSNYRALRSAGFQFPSRFSRPGGVPMEVCV